MKYTKEKLEEAVKASISIYGVMRYLGIKLTGGSHCHIKKKIKEFEINTSHFTGQGHNLGRKSNNKKSWQEILIISTTGRRADAYRLRRALIESGVEYKCSKCNNDGNWFGNRLTLEVNHKNHDWLDHRKDNLEFLCPNCHSQDKHSKNRGYTDITSITEYARNYRREKRKQPVVA
jgi:predicted RNA-binding Zn-ribbon protein involved in translation (DUF1610 family)